MDGAEQTDSHLVPFNLGPTWLPLGAADFDGNGELDILWQDLETGELVTSDIYSETSLVTLDVTPGDDWSVVATRDLDNDGRADILWHNAQTGENTLWLMDEQGQVASQVALSISAGENGVIVGTGDFDGDGDSDILSETNVLQDDPVPMLTVWLMEDTQPTGEVLTIDSSAAGSWAIAGVGDFNTDGFADILWRGEDGATTLWLMQGNQLLSSAAVEGAFGSSWQVTV
jgi:hypothetical protein